MDDLPIVIGFFVCCLSNFFPMNNGFAHCLMFFFYSFVDDEREYRWPDGAVYRGEFVAGHRQGEGTYTFSDGSTYTGEWLRGRYHGVGQCVWTDGRVYKGEWRDGKAHGYGVEKRADGTIRHEGTWNMDVPVRNR